MIVTVSPEGVVTAVAPGTATVLGALSHLTWLDLSGNQLNGDIPWELSGLASLEHLDLSDNELWGQIPAEDNDSGLGRLSNLTWLNLSGNQLNGNIPWGLGLLANLETLWLSYNQLEDSLPSELGSREPLVGLPSCWQVNGPAPMSGSQPGPRTATWTEDLESTR